MLSALPSYSRQTSWQAGIGSTLAFVGGRIAEAVQPTEIDLAWRQRVEVDLSRRREALDRQRPDDPPQLRLQIAQGALFRLAHAIIGLAGALLELRDVPIPRCKVVL